VSDDAGTRRARRAGGRGAHAAAPGPVRPALVVLFTLALTLVVLLAVFPRLWYGLDHVSLTGDIGNYQAYADQIHQGLRPYLDFDVEYPPLAVPLFRLPGAGLPNEVYMHRFHIEMGVVTLLAGALAGLAACAVWPRGRRAYLAGGLYALSVALTGGIILSRYDAAVALVLAAFVLCLVRRWQTAAAVALGIGFALKIMPVTLLPLVLLLSGAPRRWVWPLAGFTVAALAGFWPYLFTAPEGVGYVFWYHFARPLQIESALGTPMLLGQALGADWIRVVDSFGSQQLVATGARLAAGLSGPLTAAALVVVYVVAVGRRAQLRAAPDEVPLAVLALLLALMAFGKVLSPQYVVWVLPVLALVAAKDWLVGLMGGTILMLTHLEFPAMWGRMVSMDHPVVALVALRNLLLVALFCVAVWRLHAGYGRRKTVQSWPDRVTRVGAFPATRE
jgi:hypothetical protein